MQIQIQIQQQQEGEKQHHISAEIHSDALRTLTPWPSIFSPGESPFLPSLSFLFLCLSVSLAVCVGISGQPVAIPGTSSVISKVCPTWTPRLVSSLLNLHKINALCNSIEFHS